MGQSLKRQVRFGYLKRGGVEVVVFQARDTA